MGVWIVGCEIVDFHFSGRCQSDFSRFTTKINRWDFLDRMAVAHRSGGPRSCPYEGGLQSLSLRSATRQTTMVDSPAPSALARPLHASRDRYGGRGRPERLGRLVHLNA